MQRLAKVVDINIYIIIIIITIITVVFIVLIVKAAPREGGERLPKFTDFPTLTVILLITAQQVHSGKA